MGPVRYHRYEKVKCRRRLGRKDWIEITEKEKRKREMERVREKNRERVSPRDAVESSPILRTDQFIPILKPILFNHF